MIFALTDYIQYRLGAGNYGDRQRDGSMGALAFVGGIPEDIIAELEPGSIIFTQRLDSALSWAVMYFGSSPVDHTGVYVGDGNVLHMTLSGSKIHKLKVLASNARVLIVIDGVNAVCDPPSTGGMLEPRARWFHGLPPKVQLALAAIEIVLGFYPASFRWRFFADVLVTCAIIDALAYWLFHIVFAFPFALFSGCIIAVNLSIYAFRKCKGKPYHLLSHPDIGYRNFFQNGGRMVTKLGTLVVCDIGIIPYNLFLALRQELGLSGQGSDDRTNDKLNESGELCANSPEEGNFKEVFCQSKNENSNKDQN